MKSPLGRHKLKVYLLAGTVLALGGALAYRTLKQANAPEGANPDAAALASPGPDPAVALRALERTQKEIASARKAALPSPPPTFPKIRGTSDFLEQYGREWTVKESGAGQANWIYGSDIPLGSVNPERVLEFTRSVSGVFGMKEENIGPSPLLVADDGSMPQDFGTRVVQFQRLYQGRPVIDGAIQVGIDLGAQSVHSIQVVGPTPRGDLPTEVPKPKRLEARLAKQGVKLAEAAPEPRVFQPKEGDARLVYRATRGMTSPTDLSGKLVLVDAQSGEVVAEREPGIKD